MVVEGKGDTGTARLRPVELGDAHGNLVAVNGAAQRWRTSGHYRRDHDQKWGSDPYHSLIIKAYPCLKVCKLFHDPPNRSRRRREHS